MARHPPEPLIIHRRTRLDRATLVLALTGWMDGGDVSTGTVQRLIDLLGAELIAQIDPEPFYIYNLPGSMEVAALFRPFVQIEAGQIKNFDMPSNRFFVHEARKLVFFVGKEPNIAWRTFGDCILWLAAEVGVSRILFVGSFGGAVPHTREPRLFVSCSDPQRLPDLERRYGLKPNTYQGPGSFTTYLMTRAEPAGMEMISLVAEIPSYLQGTNPSSIEAVTRRLAKMLRLPLDLDELRAASTQWELQVTAAVEENAEMAKTVRELEEAYDNDLLKQESSEEQP
jgi:proteasome assembly chaperone (PAC2) family protein